LNTTTAAIRDDMLDGLDSEDKDFAREVRKAIFTFANIPERIEPRDIPRILRDLEDDIVVKALALAKIEFPKAAEYFLESLSTRMAEQLREAIQDAGTPLAADGERAMARIVGRIREMERGGELILMVGEG